MSATGDPIWSHLSASQLIDDQVIAKKRRSADTVPTGNGRALIEWLVSEFALTPYQAAVLSAGQSGPFLYGEYTIQAKENGPGLGRVFHATHRPTGYPVRLDFLAPTMGESSVALARRVATAQSHCELHHPGLTACHLLEQLPDFKFLVLERTVGIPLDQWISGKGPVAPSQAIDWIYQIADALDAMHAVDLCHGRIHPGNLLIDQGAIRLIRNPLRHAIPLRSRVSGHDSSWLLPCEYATPELSAWDRWPDASSDLYGLGGVLHFMVTGKPPFAAGSSRDVVKLHMNTAAPSIATVGGEALNRVMQSLLAKTARSRTPSVRTLTQQLSAIQPTRSNIPMRRAASGHDAFLKAVVSRKAAVAKEVAKRAADPKYQNRQSSQVAPVVKSESLIESRIVENDSFDSIARWALAACACVAVLLGVYGIRILLKQLDGPMVTARSTDVTPHGRSTDSPGAPGTPAGDGMPLPGDAGPTDGTQDRLPPSDVSDQAADTQPSPGTIAPQVAPEDSGPFEIVPDDGQLLWAPPTRGAPIQFPYCQQGAQILLVIHPADLLAESTGDLVFQSLGPDFARWRARWEKQHKVRWQDVEQLIVSVSADANSRPEIVNDIFLTQGKSCPESFKTGELANGPAGPIFRSGASACLIPPGMDARRFVVGPADRIADVGELGGTPPLLDRELESLRAWSDSKAQFTILVSPSYLLHDGRSLVTATYAAFPGAVDTFFGDGVQAALFTAHMDQNAVFAELRLAATLEAQKTLQKEMPTRMDQLPESIENYIAGLHRLDPHWRALAMRYDNMLHFFAKYARMGIENRQWVINAYLPPVAAHNVLAATELSLASGVSDTPGPSVVAVQPAPQLTSLQEVLLQKTSLTIPQQSLEFSMRDLQDDVNENVAGLPFPFVIEIVGADLQLDGITRNQQIRNFSRKNETIANLLTGLVMQANPVTTVKEPNEPDQKLVWTIGPADEEHPNPRVLITTRKASDTKGIKLPKIFRAE